MTIVIFEIRNYMNALDSILDKVEEKINELE